MSDADAVIEFDGVLSRATFADATVDLDFHPWGFDATPGVCPVLRVSIRNPALQPVDFEALLNEGVEIIVYRDRIDIWREADHGRLTWKVEVLSIDWTPYELEDFVARVNVLEAVWQRQGQELRVAQGRIDGALKLSHELIRRAKAKAELSPEMRARQDEAVRVLQRVIRALGDGDA